MTAFDNWLAAEGWAPDTGGHTVRWAGGEGHGATYFHTFPAPTEAEKRAAREAMAAAAAQPHPRPTTPPRRPLIVLQPRDPATTFGR